VADPILVVSEDPVRAARERLASLLCAVVVRRGSARLGIPGGSALAVVRGLPELLGDDWTKIRLTWVDERCVPFASADSNRGEAHRSGALDAAHPPAVELALFEDGETPAAAVTRLERAFVELLDGALDVTLLGMGPDGHVASLFPGRPPASGVASWVRESPKPPADRITLNRATLEAASHSVLVAMGESKRRALGRLLSGDPELPAVGLPGLIVFTDLEMSEEGR